MSTGDSFETRFEKIDNLLRDPKSEVNSDCLLVSAAVFSGLPWVAVCSLVNLYESQVCKVLGRCQISLLQEFWSASKSHSPKPARMYNGGLLALPSFLCTGSHQTPPSSSP